MNRKTYSLAALSLALAGGVMLAVTFSKVPVMGQASPGAGSNGMTSGPAAGGAMSLPATLAATLAGAGVLPPEPGTHDPVLIKEKDYYYLFYTGGTVLSLRSKDLIHWESPVAAAPAGRGPETAAATSAATAAATVAAGGGRGGRGGRGGAGGVRAASAFPGMPNSISAVLPNVGSLWAPDVSFYKGQYQIFYAASSFGSRNSAIGLATNKTLDPASKDYEWHDVGVVVRTQQSDNYNAIDPNFVLDEKGEPWLNFGSFWTGIKLIKLGPDGKQDPNNKTMYSIAARKPPTTAIEAPFIIREGKYFYLFVSWDKCCAGLQSTYRVMVGRAEKITGPYVDKEGVDMAAGGGTQVLAGDGARIIGPGHEGLFKDGEKWLMVHHFYDGNTQNGASKLQVRPVTFDEKAWPVVGKAINSPG